MACVSNTILKHSGNTATEKCNEAIRLTQLYKL